MTDLFGNPIRGPRPLRLRSSPWGIFDRSLRELEQLEVGTCLLLRGLHLSAITALGGGAVLVEHPALAENEEVPSIWDTAIIRELTASAAPFRLVTLEQWLYGAQAKPTTLLVANTNVEHWLQVEAQPWLPRPTSALIGRNALGSFRTAIAKEYPTLLCRAFASALCANVRGSCTDDLPHITEAARKFAFLCANFQGTMQPDFQPQR